MSRSQVKNEFVYFISPIILGGIVLGVANLQTYLTTQPIDYERLVTTGLIVKFFPYIILLLFFVIYLLRMLQENFGNLFVNLVFSIANVLFLVSLYVIIMLFYTNDGEVIYPTLSAIPKRIELAEAKLDTIYFTAITIFLVLALFQVYVLIRTVKNILQYRKSVPTF